MRSVFFVSQEYLPQAFGGSSASHVIPVFREFVTAIYPSYLQEFGLASNAVKESRAVVCRTCFGKLEKLTK